MYAVRWDEEKIIQGLAVAMCLAMVGVIVFPTIIGNATAVYAYVSGKNMDPYLAYGGLFTGIGLMKLSDFLLLAELAGCATAGVGTAALVVAGIGVIA